MSFSLAARGCDHDNSPASPTNSGGKQVAQLKIPIRIDNGRPQLGPSEISIKALLNILNKAEENFSDNPRTNRPEM